MKRREFGHLASALLVLGLMPSLSSCSGSGSSKGEEETTADAVQKMMAGAYGDYRDLEEEDMKLFQDTYKGGETLKPLKVKTQVVAGLNYRFLCQDEKGKDRFVEVTIFKPLPGRGEPEVSKTQEVRP